MLSRSKTLFVNTASQTAFIYDEDISKDYKLTPSTLARIIFLIAFSKKVHVMRNVGECITISRECNNEY